MALAPAKSLAVYRNLLRAVQGAFGSDAPLLSAARDEIRTHFEASRSVADAEEIQRLEGEEAASFLTSSSMQMQRREGDGATYGLERNANHDGGVVEPIVHGMELPKEEK